jgi:hypothetical protein
MMPLAHGLSGRSDLPIPEWLFGWTAVGVLVISFVALGALWRSPLLEHAGVRSLPSWLSHVLTSRVTEVLAGAIGVFCLGFTFWAGFAGEQTTVGNIVPTFVYVAFWVGLVPVSLLFGDVFRAFNPWRAIGRTFAFLAAKALGDRVGAGMPYPERLGYWPAAAGLFAFAWLELLSPDGVNPQSIAAATLSYTFVTFLGMGLFGVEAWSSRAEAFGVYFGLFARLSAFERHSREVVLRVPLSGLAKIKPEAGLVAVLLVMIGTVTYDGSQETSIWLDIDPAVAGFIGSLGTGPTLRTELAGGVGMIACVAVLGAFYWLGIAGARSAGGSLVGLGRAFAPSLVPIALVYVGAHYLTFLLYQGQALGSLVSDPLGRGWDLFGTAGTGIDYGLIGATVTWYCQVAFVVAGHAAGLTASHDRALSMFSEPRQAVRSQYWMLAVMIGFTSLALWLLAQANA